jgi:hypothetical protein
MSGADVAYFEDGHPLAGRFVPDLELEPVPLPALMRAGRPLLLDFAGGLPPDGRVEVVRVKYAEPPADALLLRPDGYVAWAGTPDDTLEEAVRAWFGS